MIVDRLKDFISSLISLDQMRFIPERLIHENIIISEETMNIL